MGYPTQDEQQVRKAGGKMPAQQRLLELALKGLEADRVRIDNEMAEIRSQLRGSPVATGETEITPMGRKRRKMSAAAKRKISEAMKCRYAALKAPSQSLPQA